jgi:hypothetical protein
MGKKPLGGNLLLILVFAALLVGIIVAQVLIPGR